MTLEELLGKSAAELEVMTDKELLEYFQPVLHITRPELCSKPTKNEPRRISSTQTNGFNSKKQKALAMARELGIELDL